MLPADTLTSRYFDDVALSGAMAAFSPEEIGRMRTFLTFWGVRPGDTVIEPGCGTGRLTELLAASVGTKGRVYACDISGQMVAAARNRNLGENVVIEHVSITEMSLPKWGADHAICLNVFPHLSDPKAALMAMGRALRGGGHLWINAFEGSEQTNARHAALAGTVVERHLMPGEGTMRHLVKESMFSLSEILDSGKMYSLHAVKLLG